MPLLHHGTDVSAAFPKSAQAAVRSDQKPAALRCGASELRSGASTASESQLRCTQRTLRAIALGLETLQTGSRACEPAVTEAPKRPLAPDRDRAREQSSLKISCQGRPSPGGGSEPQSKLWATSETELESRFEGGSRARSDPKGGFASQNRLSSLLVAPQGGLSRFREGRRNVCAVVQKWQTLGKFS